MYYKKLANRYNKRNIAFLPSPTILSAKALISF